jgi:hypothetical protein
MAHHRLLPETSCGRGNKYLDRAVLVPTVERDCRVLRAVTLPRVSERWGKQQFREFEQRQVQAGKKNLIQARCPFHKYNTSVWLPGSAGFQPAPEAGETPVLPGEGMNNWR